MQAPNGYVLVSAEDICSAYKNFQEKREARIKATEEYLIDDMMKPWLPWMKPMPRDKAIAALEKQGFDSDWNWRWADGATNAAMLKELCTALGTQPHLYASTEAASLVNKWKE